MTYCELNNKKPHKYERRNGDTAYRWYIEGSYEIKDYQATPESILNEDFYGFMKQLNCYDTEEDAINALNDFAIESLSRTQQSTNSSFLVSINYRDSLEFFNSSILIHSAQGN